MRKKRARETESAQHARDVPTQNSDQQKTQQLHIATDRKK